MGCDIRSLPSDGPFIVTKTTLELASQSAIKSVIPEDYQVGDPFPFLFKKRSRGDLVNIDKQTSVMIKESLNKKR